MKFELLKLIKCPYCGSNLQIAKIVNEKDELIDHYPLSEKYLARKYEIDKRSVKGRQVEISDNCEVEDLMKFILINVPNSFV